MAAFLQIVMSRPLALARELAARVVMSGPMSALVVAPP
jgi:hypothetical protein